MIQKENQNDDWQSKSNNTNSTGATPQFDNKYSVFPRTPNNALLEPMFLGQPVNVARYDQQRYEVFEKLIEKQISFFWRPEEIDVSKDRIDYAGLPENEKHIFISNLKYQCLVEGTEVLTHKGWIDLTQYDGKSEILIYDLETGTTKWEVPEYKFTKQHKGDVYRFFNKNKKFEQVVTPEHRMPFINNKTADKDFKYASEMVYKKHIKVPLNGKFVNEETQDIKNVNKQTYSLSDLQSNYSLKNISRRLAKQLCNELKTSNLLLNKEEAKFIEGIATLAGYLTEKQEFINNDDKTTKYLVNFIDKKFISGKKIKKEKLQYDGLVSCVTVSTGAFVTRYKNSVTVSGNCLLDSVQGRSPNVGFLPVVSLPELETWIESWAFFECVAEGTEVLTTNGWKDISQVTTDDNVMVYDLNKETVYFEKPKRTTNYQVDNRLMVEVVAKQSKQFHQFVTPNHRMPVKTRVKAGQNATRTFVEAGLFDYRSHHLAPVSGILETNEEVQELTYLERILIAAQADGRWQPERYTGSRAGTIPIWFTFSKEHKIERLNLLAQLAGVHIRELTKEKPKKNTKAKPQRRFKIDFPVDKVPEDIKEFSTWVKLDEFSSKKAEDFLDEVSYWDSHVHISKKDEKTFTYVSTNKSNVDIVQALAVMCGKQARYTKLVDNRKESYLDVHSVNVVNSMFKDGESIEKKLVPYTGKVYCLETSTGAFVIRYKGTVSITGNTIHSRSYTHIIRNIVNDPSLIFDDIVVNEEILKRAEAISYYYDDLISYTNYYNMLGEGTHVVNGKEIVINKRELKKNIYLCLVCVNVLEAIRFYVSFACSFAFAERELMEGNAKIIKLIARDEALHLTSTQHMINLMKSGQDDPEMKEIAHELEQETIEIFKIAAEQEKDWCDYLFKDGSMIGLNKDILVQYVEYITNLRMQAIGLEPIYPKATQNPIPWINNWLSSDNVQVAPQEVEISSYLIGQVDAEINSDELGGFEL